MAATRHVPYATEVYDESGPTGEFVEVFEMAVVDGGDNELWRGTPGDEPEYQVNIRRVATKTGKPISSADCLID